MMADYKTTAFEGTTEYAEKKVIRVTKFFLFDIFFSFQLESTEKKETFVLRNVKRIPTAQLTILFVLHVRMDGEDHIVIVSFIVIGFFSRFFKNNFFTRLIEHFSLNTILYHFIEKHSTQKVIIENVLVLIQNLKVYCWKGDRVLSSTACSNNFVDKTLYGLENVV